MKQFIIQILLTLALGAIIFCSGFCKGKQKIQNDPNSLTYQKNDFSLVLEK